MYPSPDYRLEGVEKRNSNLPICLSEPILLTDINIKQLVLFFLPSRLLDTFCHDS